MKKTVIITSVSEVKQDKNQKNYRTIEFSTPSKVPMVDEVTGEVFHARVQPKKSSINVYEESYLNHEMELGYDAQVGERFLGDIVTRKVTPYSISFINKEQKEDSRVVDTFTTVILGDTESAEWESLVKSSFRAKSHELAIPTPANFSILDNKQEEKATEEAQADSGEIAY